MNKRASKLGSSKKGFSISWKMLMWVPRFLFTVVVIGVTLYIVSAFIVNAVNVSDVESSVLMNAAYFSPKGVSVVDNDIGRVYPGVVSTIKFTQPQVQALYQHYRPGIVGRLVMVPSTLGFIGPLFTPTVYTDEERYSQWQPIAQVGGKGIGGKTAYSEKRYVTADDGFAKVVETVFIASN